MIEANINWTKENVWNFIKYNAFTKSKSQKVILITYIVCFFAVIVAGIVAFFIMQEALMLAVGGVAALMMAAYMVIFVLMMKNAAKKILKSNEDDSSSSVQLEDERIIVFNDGTPVGQVSWENVGEINLSDTAAYVITKKNALMLIEYKSLTSGTESELREFLEKKNAELSKKA